MVPVRLFHVLATHNVNDNILHEKGLVMLEYDEHNEMKSVIV